MKGFWHIGSLTALAAVSAAFFHLPYLLLLLLFWLYGLYRSRRLPGYFLFLFYTVGFILFLLAPEHGEQETFIPVPDTQAISYYGKIITPVDLSPAYFQFTFLEETLDQKIMVTYFKQADVENWEVLPVRGAMCEITGVLELPAEAENPGQFDYRAYLQKKEITYQLRLPDLSMLSCSGSSVLSYLDTFRSLALGKSQNISKETAAWLNALIWGEDGSLPEETIDIFQRWGLSHLLAISGLHVGLLAGWFYFVFIKTSILTKEKAHWFIMAVLPVYAILAGGEPAVWRASLMTFVFLFFLKIRHRISGTDGLSIVFLIVLFWQGSQIQMLGFQFSYVVTFALLLSGKLISRPESKIFTLLKIGLLAQLAVLPFQLRSFFFFNPLSILLNLLVIPYFTIFFIPVLLLLAVFLLFSSFLAGLLDDLISFVHASFLDLLKLADAAYSPWVTGSFPVGLFIPYYVVFIFFLFYWERNKEAKAFMYACLLVFLLGAVSLYPYLNSEGSVTMLDVGQGDSFIIELPYREGVIIIDAAGSVGADFQTATDKTYKQVIKPYLYSRGISRIDALVLSHEDLDHTGSVPYLLKEFPVDYIYSHPYYSLPSSWTYDKKATVFRAVRKGDIFRVADQIFYVLSPAQDYKAANDNSLVIYTKAGGMRWLFTGDIGERVEKDIIETYPSLQADILKVAHHGSKSSSSPGFIASLHPRMAWISAGKRNRYGHPAPEVTARLEKDNIFIYRTDQKRAVQYKFSGEKGRLREFEP